VVEEVEDAVEVVGEAQEDEEADGAAPLEAGEGSLHEAVELQVKTQP
jgi:hypothetical protein